MNTKAMYDLKEMISTDLDQYARKGSLTRNDLDTVFTMTGTLKNLCKITMMEEEGSSYGNGNWNAMGSYSNGRMPMSDGRYSGRMMRDETMYDEGNSGRRYMRNNYSSDSENMENRMRREMYN